MDKIKKSLVFFAAFTVFVLAVGTSAFASEVLPQKEEGCLHSECSGFDAEISPFWVACGPINAQGPHGSRTYENNRGLGLYDGKLAIRIDIHCYYCDGYMTSAIVYV